MQWIHDYDLFLFDFDGLLVNTEELHYRAYQTMLKRRGISLPWTLQDYLMIAHFSSEGLREEIYRLFQDLQKNEPRWDVLYKEKTEVYLDFLSRGDVQLMDGVDSFLKELKKRGKRTCVVTNSTYAMIEKILNAHPPLDLIDYWVTREDYQQPKPNSECYILAIKKYGMESDRIIGFEDSPRGLEALLSSGAHSVFVTELSYPNIDHLLAKVKKISSFDALLSDLDHS